ncbi:2-oxo acid dehydrogenase subunit E2 [Dactylosporangium aurantiacum]|uniref:Dihydrolipoamide acetyltransferase component of pyruvate dehydrogenase complex n=1 Tax=Dactylosporangium aurantiacum TaxID=35754 RepID=A0A9Q9IQ59_9ACTN|nr:2-oxo acid dehydrogenase subunit E2 [Dactylosporangium aurantiacum]MDG6109849.1 2-oxo acid dehydrogenase subunit E2 [Dactylosporangium aurantiacum]UWZ57832.1 2-oxo acid dehydrogenase subunit E2 [Dactylosporangium aurantiacum]
MTDIVVPKLNANDTTYTLVEWIVPAGATVGAGDPVATVETSKAAEELPSPGDGVLHHVVAVGAECAPGAVLGRLSPSAAGRDRFPAPEPDGAADRDRFPAPEPDRPVITEPALRVMEEHGIAPSAVRALGRKVVRAADLAPLLPPGAAVPGGTDVLPGAVVPLPGTDGSADDPGSGRRLELPAAQRAVGAVVAESHRTVPAAFVAVKVPLDAAVAHAQALTRRYRRLVGVPELLIAAVGTLLATHPLCFARLVAPGVVHIPGSADVGVTIDVGKGLHVPVLRAVDTSPVRDVAAQLMAHRMTALRGTFRAADLTGATIMLALHTDDDVTHAVPVLLPGTSCALSLAGRQTELFLDAGGAVAQRTVVQLGLAYDHRILNGRDAVAFLRDLSALLQHPTDPD